MLRSLLVTSIIAAFATNAAYAQTACANLKSLSLPTATVTMAEPVAAGAFKPPAAEPAAGVPAGVAPAANARPAAPLTVPAFCRVALTLAPSADSHIEMEVWLPVNWNGKFQAVGGGGWAGVISYPAMVTALNEGYATSSNDTGHKGGNAQFALGHPEKITDFGYRAMHEMTLKAKAVIQSHYGRAAKYSYFNGCSTGGRQALVEAFRYPEDYDGIVAGAPAHPHVYLHAAGVAMSIDLMKIAEHTLNAEKLQLLANSVMKACDALDGVEDGLVSNPQKCNFDPATLLCKAGDGPTCLTAPQLAAVQRAYTDTKTKKGELIWSGHAKGGEPGWGMLRTQATTVGNGGFDTIRILGHQDADYDWRNFDLDKDVALTEDRSQIDVISSDLSKFKAHGGKLLLYHGWADATISPGHTVAFYDSVLAKMGKQDDFLKLYMIPGMQHCGGGPGPNQFSMMGAMERWRESNETPTSILATHVANNRVDRTRPLCAYPQVAKYKGTGSTNDAASFSCAAP